MLNRFAKDYFNFTRKERTGIICLLVLIIFFLILPFFFSYFTKQPNIDTTQFEKEIAALNVKQPDSTGNYPNKNFDEDNYQNYYQPSEKNYYTKSQKGELFYFDPNSLSVDGWIKLGIRERTANSIQKYVSKGGKFYKPEDIGKIWGLRKEEVERLLPYVKIPARPSPVYTNYKNGDADKYYEKQKYAIANVDINLGDTTAFISLPGIGGKLATRIVAFREKLGGFYAIEQVAETFGLPDSTYKKIKDKLVMANPTVKKININNATVDELKTHPYIRYNIANAIVQYRLQHGSYKDINDIKKIMLVTDEIYNKAAPYLAVQ